MTLLLSKTLTIFENLLIIFLFWTPQTDENESEKEQEQELPRHSIETQNHTPENEPSITNSFDTNDSQNNGLELIKQRQLIEKLQRLSNLKRKSEEFLQKNYFTDILNPISEKKLKISEKLPYNKHNQMVRSSYDNLKNMFDEPLDISSGYKPVQANNLIKETSEKNKELSSSDNTIELKTECDDDIIVTDPAVCTTPKSYDGSREGKKDVSLPLDYQSPQDSKFISCQVFAFYVR